MSAWRVLVKRLHAIGGSGTRDEFDDPALPYGTRAWGLSDAKRLGLIVHNGKRQGCIWYLTDLGRAFCEGRAEVRKVVTPSIGNRPRIYIGASWLSQLEQA